MKELLLGDERITSRLGEEKVEKAFKDIFTHIGDAPQRCIDFLNEELYPATREESKLM